MHALAALGLFTYLGLGAGMADAAASSHCGEEQLRQHVRDGMRPTSIASDASSVVILFRDTADEVAIRKFLKDLGLEGEADTAIRFQDCKTSLEVWHVNVPRGDAAAMAELLARASIVDSVGRVPLLYASVDAEATARSVISNSREGAIKATRAVAPAAADVPAHLQALLADIYRKRGTFDVLAREPDHLKVLVHSLRGEVLPNEAQWERLEMRFYIVPDTRGVHLHAVLDGSHASGVGLHEPSLESFNSMSTKYDAELNIYLQKLVAQLQDGLEKPK